MTFEQFLDWIYVKEFFLIFLGSTVEADAGILWIDTTPSMEKIHKGRPLCVHNSAECVNPSCGIGNYCWMESTLKEK